MSASEPPRGARGDADRPSRRSIRLPEHDYAAGGVYFVTICAAGRRELFGSVSDGVVRLTALGEAVVACWEAIPRHCPGVSLDAFVVMPNHVHGIVVIAGRPHCAGRARADGVIAPGSLGAVVRSFKAAVTRQATEIRGVRVGAVWQRGYWEHVVRDDRDRDAIRDYIHANPARWQEDSLHPDAGR